jgi:tetratricopeptide (TPR) repeat protein
MGGTVKKNVALFIFMALVLAVAAPGWAARAPAQKPAAKDAVETPFPSRVGDRARYAMTMAEKGDAGKPTMTTDVTIEISGADESGFLITWTYGKFRPDPPGEEASPEELRIVDLMSSVRLLLQLERGADSLKLANWEEIQERLTKGLEMIQEQMKAQGAGQQEAGKLASQVKTFYENREFMTAYYTKDPSLFFAYLGKRIPTSQPVDYDMAVPNFFFGGDPFPARGRLSLKEYDQAHHRAVILATASLDPSQMPKIMEKIARGFVEKFAPEMADSMPKDMFKALSVDSKTEVALDLTSGWPESLTFETSMTIEMSVPDSGSNIKVNRGETITMKRIVGDAPPEIPRAAGKWQALLEDARDLGGKGQLDRAVEVGERALKIAERSVGPDDPELAPILDTLGDLYLDQGWPQEAGTLYERALAIREKALGPDHPDVVKDLSGHVDFYESLGQNAKAIALCDRLLAIREKTLGPEDPQVATVLDRLARLHYYERQYAEAEPLWRRSLAIREKALGPDHPDVATNLYDLAMLFQVQSKYAEAEPLWKRSLAIREKSLGPDHPDLALTLNFLAELYRATHREKEAEELEARAARIRSIKR